MLIIICFLIRRLMEPFVDRDAENIADVANAKVHIYCGHFAVSLQRNGYNTNILLLLPEHRE